jgi:hypothetical protein
MQDVSTIEWLDPWDDLGPEKRAAFERELRKELMEGHPLYGVAATAIARNHARDDVLFALHGHVHPYAVVHLVWQGPQRPPWPDTALYASLEDWAKDWMKPDHALYNEDG